MSSKYSGLGFMRRGGIDVLLASAALALLLGGCHDADVPVHAAGAAASAPAAAAAPAVSKSGLKMWVRYPEPAAALSAAAQLGKRLFFDASLSASGKMSCATCHSPDHAYGPPNGLAVQLGGADMQRQGTRAVPSLRYLGFTPRFTRHYYVPGPDDTEDEGPTGGFTHDGAVDTLHEQALIPLLNVNEMANPGPAAVVARLQQGSYAAQFRQVYGADIFDHPAAALEKATLALEAFQTEDPSFHPYTSKFDAAMAGNADFTPAELRGYGLFNNPNKGNCAKCHVDTPGPGGRPAQFTDFGFQALGVPRNPEIAANRDPHYTDLGICGPDRKDMMKEAEFCGMFKSPTLRNVATRGAFFHNGRFHTLEDMLHFYAERDTDPGKWYPKVKGKVVKYDDLPPRYRGNIDSLDAPLNRKAGQAPALDDAEIGDLIAFLKTLNDGYSARSGAARIE
ncbi:cytochrome-c peroxidase [Collimonas humicola]|uniref:cytochrome-c peroxidase n=1 Tax=Collimonas humicola TaxID=2825886 RepID=UPI001E506A6D|nr:cytochrome c peroxidase [Collimonas humicola]